MPCASGLKCPGWQSLGSYFHPREWNLSLLQPQPVMSPPSGWPRGRQTPQLPGLEKNAHWFDCGPTAPGRQSHGCAHTPCTSWGPVLRLAACPRGGCRSGRRRRVCPLGNRARWLDGPDLTVWGEGQCKRLRKAIWETVPFILAS